MKELGMFPLFLDMTGRLAVVVEPVPGGDEQEVAVPDRRAVRVVPRDVQRPGGEAERLHHVELPQLARVTRSLL